MEATEKKNTTCPKCAAVMNFQGIESVGAGSARLFRVEVYLCPKCGCNGRYDEAAQKIVEIR